MAGPDDPSDLFAPSPSGPAMPMYYRQGVIIEWDPITAANVVQVGGSVLSDLPILNSTETLLLAPGAVVGLMVVRLQSGASSWAIMGRLVIPGSDEAGSALSAIRSDSVDIETQQSTTSSSYTDLATVGPTLTNFLVGKSGRAIVLVSAEITATAPSGSAIQTGTGYMAFDVSGATVVGTLDRHALRVGLRYDAGGGTSSIAFESQGAPTRAVLLTGLNPGLHTITARYKVLSGGNTAQFAHRNLTAIAL